MTKKLYRWSPGFNRAIEIFEQEAKDTKWNNSEGIRVIAKYKYGAKVSKLNGNWNKIVCVDDKLFAWLLLKL